MLRLLRKNFSNQELIKTLNSLSLRLDPDKIVEKPAVEPEKKKVKFDLSKKIEPQYEKIQDVIDKINSFPTTNHEVPDEFSLLDKERSSRLKSMKYATDRYKNFIEGLRTIPTEGVHYHLRTKLGKDDGLDSLQVRSYISNLTRSLKSDGFNAGSTDVPKAALLPYDETMIKTYKKVDNEGRIIDYSHWAQWYLNNQPKDIADLDKSDWEPVSLNFERVSDEDELINQLERNEKYGNTDPQNESRAIGSGTENILQADLIEEFMEREYNFKADVRRGTLQSFLTTDYASNASFHTPLEDYNFLAPCPPKVKMDYIGFNNDMEAWGVFRMFPMIQKIAKDIRDMDEKFNTDKEWVPVKLPSLINYYETLPNYYKNHRFIQAMTLILEKYHPKVPRKRKELFINRFCNILTPKNPEKLKFLQEYLPLPKGAKDINLPDESEFSVDDKNPVAYDIESEGVIEFMGKELYSDKDIDPEIRAKIEAKRQNWKEGDSDTVEGPTILAENGELPESFLKKNPNALKEGEDIMKKIIDKLYPGSDVEFDYLEDDKEGNVDGIEFKKFRHKHKNLTRGDVFEVSQGAEHLVLPEDYMKMEEEIVIETIEKDDDKIHSDIEITIDKSTGAIKDMRTSKKLQYDKRGPGYLGGGEEEMMDRELESDDNDLEDSEKSDLGDEDESDDETDSDEDDDDDDEDESDDREISSDENFMEKEGERASEEGSSDSDDDEEDDEENEDDSESVAEVSEEGSDSDSDEDEDDDDDDSESDNYSKQQGIDEIFSPEQQLKKAMGHAEKKKEKDAIEYNIIDREVNWFERNHENPDGIIPSTITFYDNDDGYWDHWIKIKRERAGLPDIGSRPYFR